MASRNWAIGRSHFERWPFNIFGRLEPMSIAVETFFAVFVTGLDLDESGGEAGVFVGANVTVPEITTARSVCSEFTS